MNDDDAQFEFQTYSLQSQGGGAVTSELSTSLEDDGLILLDFGSDMLESDFDINYGLLKPEETVLIRAYSDDTDDRMLTEIKPKFIVMFEPDMDFVRRVEVNLCLLEKTPPSPLVTYTMFHNRFTKALIPVLQSACTIWCIATPARNINTWLG